MNDGGCGQRAAKCCFKASLGFLGRIVVLVVHKIFRECRPPLHKTVNALFPAPDSLRIGDGPAPDPALSHQGGSRSSVARPRRVILVCARVTRLGVRWGRGWGPRSAFAALSVAGSTPAGSIFSYTPIR